MATGICPVGLPGGDRWIRLQDDAFDMFFPAMARVFLADLPDLRYILITARRPAHTPG